MNRIKRNILILILLLSSVSSYAELNGNDWSAWSNNERTIYVSGYLSAITTWGTAFVNMSNDKDVAEYYFYFPENNKEIVIAISSFYLIEHNIEKPLQIVFLYVTNKLNKWYP